MTIEQVVLELSEYNVIFSGSYVLKLFKMLPEDRVVNDIDLVFKEQADFDKFIADSKSIVLPLDEETYQDQFYKVTNTLWEGITIDCFFNPSVDIVTIPTSYNLLFGTLSVQNPRQILQQKLGILYDRIDRKDKTYTKHRNDLLTIFGEADASN
jgi:hypothetical protein